MASSSETRWTNLQKLQEPNSGRILISAITSESRFYWEIGGMGGRSEGSKNRYYKFRDHLGRDLTNAKTEVHDEDLQKGKGPADATLYVAQGRFGNWDVASNGKQTEGVGEALAGGKSFEDGQNEYENEGPENDYTARITIATNYKTHEMILGKIVSKPDNPAESTYHTWRVGRELQPIYGGGYLIRTYDGKGGLGANYEDPLPVLLPDDFEEAIDLIWQNWDPNTRGNLLGKEIDRLTGAFRYMARSIHEGRE